MSIPGGRSLPRALPPLPPDSGVWASAPPPSRTQPFALRGWGAGTGFSCRQRPAHQGLQPGVLPQHGEPHGRILPRFVPGTAQKKGPGSVECGQTSAFLVIVPLIGRGDRKHGVVRGGAGPGSYNSVHTPCCHPSSDRKAGAPSAPLPVHPDSENSGPATGWLCAGSWPFSPSLALFMADLLFRPLAHSCPMPGLSCGVFFLNGCLAGRQWEAGPGGVQHPVEPNQELSGRWPLLALPSPLLSSLRDSSARLGCRLHGFGPPP